MELVFELVLQLIAEIGIDVICFAALDAPSSKRRRPERGVIWPVCMVWIVLGAGIGALTLLVVPQGFIKAPWLRILNLLLAPVVCAVLSKALAVRSSAVNPHVIARNHFWYGFWFTAALGGVRFAFAS